MVTIGIYTNNKINRCRFLEYIFNKTINFNNLKIKKMYKYTFLSLLVLSLISCKSSVGESQEPLELYKKIYNQQSVIKKFEGYSISRRGYFYVFDNKKGVYLIENFEENISHHLDFNNKVQISKEKEEEIYQLLNFIEKYKIIAVQADFQGKKNWQRIEFRANENKILVYYNDSSVENNLKNVYKSFEVIDDNWGQFENKMK